MLSRRRLLSSCLFVILVSMFAPAQSSRASVGNPLDRLPIAQPWHHGAPPNLHQRASKAARAALTHGWTPPQSGVSPDANSVFLEAPAYGSGGADAVAVAVADVNGDGKLDLVVANYNSNSVGVQLGKGDGTFQTAVSYGSGGYDSDSVAVADVNGDGKLDLVVANYCADSNCTNGSVGVLLGKGDGTFQTAMVTSSGALGANYVALADVNGDGKPDVLVANECASSSSCSRWLGPDGSVGVLLGNGDGTFQAAVLYGSGGNGGRSVAVGDVNGDGKLDLLVANECLSNAGDCAGLDYGEGGAGVLLGNGDGTFQTAVSYGSGGWLATSIAIADVNGDGEPDLVLANACASAAWGNLTDYLCTSNEGSVGVLLGLGGGTFQTAVSYDSGGYGASSVAAADVNGDGKADVVVANAESNTVGVLLGNGNGTFQTAALYGPGDLRASSIALADVNGDGRPDLLVANGCGSSLWGFFTDYPCTSNSGSVGVLLGNGGGAFQAAVAHGSGGYEADSVVAADVNGDGRLDLLVLNACAGTSGNDCRTEVVTGSVGVLLGNGDGTFQTAVNYDTGGYEAGSIAVADVNGDGKLDLVVANDYLGSVGVLLGNGDGTFQTAVVYRADGADSVAIADVNGDGKPDLLVANACARDNCSNDGELSVWLGNGDGTFQTAVSYDSGGVLADTVKVMDVNGDGKPDLVVANECATGDANCANGTNGNVGVLLGNGDGTFQTAAVYGSGGRLATSLAIADINGDGRPDLVVANYCASSSNCTNGIVGILLGNGDGSFQAATKTSTPGLIESGQLVVADFNGDGKSDIASGAGNFLLLGNGDGSFQNALLLGAGGTGIAAGDFNNDGSPDLAVGGVTILLNRVRVLLAVALSRTSLTFPTQVVSMTSKAQTVTLTNTGLGILHITSLAVTGPFAQTNTCGATIAAGASCTLSVTFNPTKAGSFTGSLSITDNAPTSPQKVSLTGTGTSIRLTPTSANFNDQPVGTRSPGKKITFSNKGSVTVKITSISITGTNAGDFAQTNTCGKSVAAGASCSITITFKPLAKGNRTAAVSISDNGGGSPQKVSVAGTGI